MGVLFVLSSIPGAEDLDGQTATTPFAWIPPPLQNLLHLPAYGLLAILWCRALRAWRLDPPYIALIAFLATCTYAALDEYHQSFVPGRYSTATDVILNVVGAGIGIVLYHRYAVRGGRSGA